jgi:hypothetical protein
MSHINHIRTYRMLDLYGMTQTAVSHGSIGLA